MRVRGRGVAGAVGCFFLLLLASLSFVSLSFRPRPRPPFFPPSLPPSLPPLQLSQTHQICTRTRSSRTRARGPTAAARGASLRCWPWGTPSARSPGAGTSFFFFLRRKKGRKRVSFFFFFLPRRTRKRPGKKGKKEGSSNQSSNHPTSQSPPSSHPPRDRHHTQNSQRGSARQALWHASPVCVLWEAAARRTAFFTLGRFLALKAAKS